MGNPHAVFFLESVPQLPPNTNVEFVRVRNPKELEVRVIERGSGETMACGTGACAAAVAAIYHGLAERKVTVHLPGGALTIEWNTDSSMVLMTGPATEVFRGEYMYS
jgi:diaminopimelate epimerase